MSSPRRNPQQMILQNLLRDIRKQQNVYQDELAKRLGWRQSVISKYESGEKLLTFVEVEQICKALGVDFQDFVEQYQRKTDEAEYRVHKLT
jgi:transcriptional regulator with XRE-family HTH domain